ncbi:MAG: Universal stress protein family [uncultured Caballeronia sp.]|nr:MAG: Universal stress protein family [uncultured Caballeronia sp.]
MFKHILVPTDGSELSQKAIDGAIDLAQSVGARITAYACLPQYPYSRRSRTLPSSRLTTTSTPAPRTKRASICARSSAPPKARACRAPA